MKHRRPSQDQNQYSTGAAFPAVTQFNQSQVDFTTSTDELARRAYFSYVNEGSRPGHDVQHWLEAEKELLAERKLTRTHGFHIKS